MRYLAVISFLLTNGHWTAAFEIRQPSLLACIAYSEAVVANVRQTSPDIVSVKWECRDVTA